MMVYAQFIEQNTLGKAMDAMGSNGMFILDGRNTLDTMILDAIERADRLRNVKPGYIGFKIMKCGHMRDAGHECLHVGRL